MLSIPTTDDLDIVHGTNSTYCNHGCRCAACKDAHAAYARGEKPAVMRTAEDTLPRVHWTDRSWQDQALCSDQPKAMFFPDENTNPLHIRRAVETCLACPVIVQCGHAARNEVDGIWAAELHRIPKMARRRYLELIDGGGR